MSRGTQAEPELSLKVMRLSKPCLHSTPLVVMEEPWMSLVNSSSESTNVPSLLSLPTSFGNIYLGETFSAFLSLTNDSLLAASEVAMRIEVQTTTQRLVLVDAADGITPSSTASTLALPSQKALQRFTLAQGDARELTVSHDIKEIGTHILICTIQYLLSSEKRQFRKFFKFQVLNPLAVKTKVHLLPNHSLILEAQIQNTMHTALSLENVSLQVAEQFTAEDFNEMPSSESLYGDLFHLLPKDTRQYLYLLKPLSAHAKTATILGKLDISWRTHLGQLGRLQTSPLTRKLPATSSDSFFSLSIVSLPKTVHSETPFDAILFLRNDSSKSVNLHLSTTKAKMGSILLAGHSESSLGVLSPGAECTFSLTLVPLYSGIQKLTGLSVVDLISGTSQDLDLEFLVESF